MSIYLDYNASTLIDDRVLETMIHTYRNIQGNPDSRTHDFGQNARQAVEQARQQIADLLGIIKNELIFTSGATESDNLAILGLAEYGIAQGKKHIITTAIEHKAVLEPAKVLESRGFEVEFIRPDQSGRINADELLSKVRPDTLLVSVMHANNETGIIQPIQEIGAALAGTATYFHIDAAQSCGKLVEELRHTRYDLLSLTAHKMYGPQGIGALVLRTKGYQKPPLQPLCYGGGHEGGLRPGTLPVALIVGLGKACQLAAAEYQVNQQQYQTIKEQILAALQASGVDCDINGDQDYCLASTLNISFRGVDSEALMLASKQYCGVSNGSACTSHDYRPSHVLTAMGLPEARIESAIRISWGYDRFAITQVQALLETAKQLA